MAAVEHPGRYSTGKPRPHNDKTTVGTRSLAAGIDGLYVKGLVENAEVTFLVDTGANITIIRPDVYYRIDEITRVPLERKKIEMVMADGKPLSFQGQARFKVNIGNEDDTEVLHEVWVADIELEGILGYDFLRKYNCNLECGKGEMKFKDADAVECSIKNSQPTCCRVVADTTVCIPPRGEVILPGRVVDGYDLGIAVMKPTTKFIQQHDMMVARVLVDTREGQVPVRLLNLSDHYAKLYKGTNLATCEPIEEIVPFEEQKTRSAVCQTRDTSMIEGQIPEHLKDLYIRCRTHLDDEQRENLKKLLVRNQDAFASSSEDLGNTSIYKHNIDTGTAKPIRQQARRLPIHQRAEAEAEVNKMLKRGIIELSSSPWASPIVLVKKKDGTIRFCVDYRKLNAVTIKDSYPLPRIDDSLDALSGSSWFSTLDLQSGYWQVEMAMEDREKTAFVTGTGVGFYQFKVMPFGLCNAPATFERLMERVLTGLPWQTCLLYLDDIVTYGQSFQQALERLEEVMVRLKTAGLKLSPKKCHLFQKSVLFLGHEVSEKGIATDDSKIDTVREWPTPRNVTDVRSFLGLCSYYRRFVKGFAEIAKPLHRLTEKQQQFIWTEDCEIAFKQLKTALISTPILAYPTSGDSFILDTDASNMGIGAVLSQIQEGTEKVIAYFSRTLTKAERRYCVTRKELLALVASTKHFHHYLYGRKFLIRTDHGALRWLMNFKSPEGQTARWLERMGTYTFEIQHRAGIKHGNADGLSRRPCDDCEQCNRVERNSAQRQTITHSMRTSHTGTNAALGKVDDDMTGDKMNAEAEKLKQLHCVVIVSAGDDNGNGVMLEDGVWPSDGRQNTAMDLDEQDRDLQEKFWNGSYGPKGGRGCTAMDSEEGRKNPEEKSEDGERLRDSQRCTAVNLGQGEECSKEKSGDGEECISAIDLRESQLRDKTIGQVIQWKESGDRRPEWSKVSPGDKAVKRYWTQWDRLEMRDGVLYRRWESEKGDRITWQLVLPKELRREITQRLHSDPTSGHLGKNKTLDRIQRRFYWYEWRQEVSRVCKTCDVCAARKPPQKKYRSRMKQYNVGVPMERIAIDVMGPLPCTEDGNKYILVVGDYFTKWTEAYAIPNQEATTVATKLTEEFICRYGVPLQLHSDQGRNFESNLFQEVCRILGIEKSRTTALHPQSDGMIERFNRTLEAMLAMFVSDNQRDWDRCLPYVMMAYRTSVHETTGCTPSEMMMGRDVRLPADLLTGRFDDDTCDEPIEYVEKLQDRLEQVHQYAREHLKIASDRQKKNYDHKAQEGGYNKGDAVWLHNPRRKKGFSPKLQRPWDGPYLVTKRLSDVTYRIQKGARSKPRVVHHNRLKPYCGENTPTWLSSLSEKDNPRDEADMHSTSVTDFTSLADGDAVIKQENCDEDNTVLPEIADKTSEENLRRSQRSRRPPVRFDDN